VKPRIHLVIERENGVCTDTESEQVTSAMMDAAEDLFTTLTTGERPLIKNLYDLCAQAFGTTREDAKRRLVAAAYGKPGKALP
jgi:hypothetical protein